MVKKTDDDGLAYKGAQFSRPNIWSLPDVASDPIKCIEAWAVFRATPLDAKNEDYFGLHFMGRNLADWCGAVSSKIVSFDPKTMRGITLSGRVYQLIGLPGYSDDAHYVRHAWGERNKVAMEDATEEFLKQYGMSIEELEKAVHAQNAAASGNPPAKDTAEVHNSCDAAAAAQAGQSPKTQDAAKVSLNDELRPIPDPDQATNETPPEN